MTTRTNNIRLGLQKLETRESPSSLSMQLRTRRESAGGPPAIQQNVIKLGDVGGYDSPALKG